MTALAEFTAPLHPLKAPAPIGEHRPRPPERRRRPNAVEQRDKRRRSHAFGLAAEASVSQFLRAGGYDIVGRRCRVGGVEVDVIAVRDDTLAFIEVKARRRGLDGYYAVDTRKKARMTTAAETWLMAHPEHQKHAIRFDVAVVGASGALDYVENAFDAVTLDQFVW